MTKEEFVKGYAKRSRVTVKWLAEKGLIAIPCNCEYEECKGWRMINKKDFDYINNINSEEKRQ